MRYIDYAIKYIIRRLLRIILKPKLLISLLIIFLICFSFFKINSQAFSGDDTYTDKNVVMFLAYDNFIIDLVDRLSNCNRDNIYNDLISYLRNPDYGYYVYYGDVNGDTMTGSTWAKDTINIAIYPKTATTSSNPFNDSYLSLGIFSIRNFTCPYVYQITGKEVFLSNYDVSVAFPVDLFNYQSSMMSDFLYDNSDSNTQDVVNAIDKQTQATQEQTEKIEQQTETMTSIDYDDTVVSIDGSSASSVDNSSTNAIFSNLFSKFSSLLDSENWDSVSTISLNLPFVPKDSPGITLNSDMLSSILSQGPLGTLITVSWYSLFGLYVFKFANKIYLAIKSGDILSGLSLNDEVITSTML